MSCGGVEAYDFVSDARVTTVGIFNSGHLDVNRANRELPSVTKPIFFFLGGQSDIAYGNVRVSTLILSSLLMRLNRASVTIVPFQRPLPSGRVT